MKISKFWQLIIPILSVVFVIAVLIIGNDVRVKLRKVEASANVIGRFTQMRSDLNVFSNDITTYRKIPIDYYQDFLNSESISLILDFKVVSSLKGFFGEFRAHTQPVKVYRTTQLLDKEISEIRIELSSLSQDLKIRWIQVFILGLLGCIFAISSSLLYILFENKTRKLQLAEEEKSKALVKAEKGQLVKKEFLNIISHEIKTYLNAITGLTNIIMYQNKDDHLKENLEMLRLSNLGLISFVDNSIDLGNLESGEITLSKQTINLENYLNGVNQSFITSAEENNVELSLQINGTLPHEVLGDPYRLNQILFNLIKNAIKFGSNGKVTISIKVLNSTQNEVQLRFSIIDTGNGIKPEETKRIFKDFTQANSSISKKYGGSGIGLSIIKELLTLMGSKIQLKSEPNKGSIFYFELKMEVTTWKAEDRSSSVQPDILIVDDNKINRLILNRYLEELNLVVDEATSGQEAIEMCERNNYSIVFMDLQMPIMDGIETSERIKANDPTNKISIFAVSANSKEVMEEKCANVNFAGFIPKPIDRELLIKIVNDFC